MRRGIVQRRRVQMIRPLPTPPGARSYAMGDTAPATTAVTTDATTVAPSVAAVTDWMTAENASYAAGALCAYHGYRRSDGSIIWAIIWALMGKWKPLYVVPIAIAQGVGRRKTWITVEGPR